MTNRHERRKRARIRRSELRQLSIDGIKPGGLCAWKDCSARYVGPQPARWRYLLLYGAPAPVLDLLTIPAETWDQDVVLCPDHARALQELLKDFGGTLSGPTAGEA